jgi:DNA polymerase alpha-associated DNA helicase A
VCWIPIFKAKKLILAGDPMQLPPTILSLDRKKSIVKETKAKLNPQTDAKSKARVVTTPPDASKESANSDSESEGSESDTRDSREKPLLEKMNMGKRTPILRPPRSLEVTLFDRLERMYGSKIKTMLQVQYRYSLPFSRCVASLKSIQNAFPNLRFPFQDVISFATEI